MQVVAGVIDHRVERAACAQPGVELLAQRLLAGLVVVVQRRAGQGAGEGRQGGAQDAQSAPMGLFGQRPIAVLQLGQRRTRLLPGEGGAGPADVVDADQHDHAGHAGLIQCIALQAGQNRLAHAVTQQPAAGDASVDHRDASGCQPRGQMVGPALVLVEAGGGAVSDRVADHHHAACAGCGADCYAGQEQACGGGGGSIQVARQALVAAGDPTGLAAVPVEGLQRRRPRHENADLQGLLIAGGQCQRIAQPFLARADQHAGLAVEVERPWCRARSCGHAGRSYPQRLRAVGIAQPYPQARPAQADARGLAEGLVVQRCRDQGREQEVCAPPRLRAGLPAGHPVRGRGCAGGAGQGEQGAGSELAEAVHGAIPGKGAAMVIPPSSVN
ncbi:hypothetical protein G6F22_013960 [Rhizopus arrhizus]|nr:hypothetical protein G6F22_013960 [Rhizopus arrhizus]